MEPTIHSIAKKAGVSIATVSRVFDPIKSKLVSPGTKEKILKIVKEEGYYPNSQARYLAGAPVNILGVVLPNESFFYGSYYTTEIIRGVTEKAENLGFNIMLFATHHPLKYFNYQKITKSKIVSGLILVNTGADEINTIKDLYNEKIPFVVVNNYIKNMSINYVDLDNVEAAYQAVVYLIKKGHKKIAILNGQSVSRNAKDRMKGYKKALKEYNIPLTNEYIMNGEFLEVKAKEAVTELLKLKNLPSAIFCSNDGMALGAIHAVKENNLRIPDDIAIIGFDDSRLATVISPSLSSVHQPLYEIGSTATKILIERLQNPNLAPCKVIFKGELVIRESSG
ncbi:MAG: LacI family DNA-binding transcriptional regulator [Spirochaetes bacterium]|nr:LacI family DNA-binding transcriptional regulator [Spirochaetota bacterium]